MLQSLRNYMSAESRARRQRADERQILTAELRSLTAHRVYGYSREAAILKRLRVLDRADAPIVVERRAAPRIVMVEDDACLPEGWFPADIDIPRELAMVSR